MILDALALLVGAGLVGFALGALLGALGCDE